MKGFGFLLVGFAALLLAAASLAHALPDQNPRTVRYSWLLRWPEKGQGRVFVKEFRAPPGLMRRVSVSIAGRRVASPPDISIISTVGCVGKHAAASAQRTWLWNGRSVFVALLLNPNRCSLAGTAVHVRVALTSVGT